MKACHHASVNHVNIRYSPPRKGIAQPEERAKAQMLSIDIASYSAKVTLGLWCRSEGPWHRWQQQCTSQPVCPACVHQLQSMMCSSSNPLATARTSVQASAHSLLGRSFPASTPAASQSAQSLLGVCLQKQARPCFWSRCVTWASDLCADHALSLY